jgi:hypothetical protein
LLLQPLLEAGGNVEVLIQCESGVERVAECLPFP